MKVAWLFAACILSWVMWGIALLCIAHKAQSQIEVRQADYRQCITVHTGPIQRPDHAHPFRSRGGIA